jgi:inosine triphosphate pyrophosphatase
MAKKVYFITGNKNKLKEAQAILNDFEILHESIELPELQGEPEDIVKEKAKLAAKKLNKPVFVEDTCLCFNALNGMPGPYVKHFIEKIGREGVVRLLSDYEDKSAKAVAIIGYCEPEKEPKIFEGVVEGTIVEPRGESGFGWDPIFIPRGHSRTFAEMSVEEKNKISHRKKALEEFKSYLEHL